MLKLQVVILASLGLLFTACGPSAPKPELGEIYNAAAQRSHAERNPIIVIPGVIGTRLVSDPGGEVVWGVFGPGGVDHRSAEGRRALALPISSSGWPRDEVRPDFALEELEVSLGFNFQFKAYANMLAAFGAGGYIDPAHVDLGDVDYGDEHFTCFQFGYDWRRSCAENAAELGRFIEEKRREVSRKRRELGIGGGPVKFDLVAHSMGGLVARYYLMYGKRPLTSSGDMPVTWSGARHVDKLIMVGTPNGGSVYAYRDIFDGMRLAPLLPRIPAAVVGTMPSAFELMPPGEAGALIDEHSEAINPYAVDEWDRRGWGMLNPEQDDVLAELMPETTDPAERRRRAKGHLDKMLRNARAFHRAISCECRTPGGLEFFAFVGDAVPTASRVQIEGDGSQVLIDYLPGDKLVTRRSALRDKRPAGDSGRVRSPIPWAGVNFVFTDHLKMTSDPAFTDNVLYLLLERP
ncbi:MAG: hypothetical protein AAGI48_00800 [Verrucomicrobiota bacterium]